MFRLRLQTTLIRLAKSRAQQSTRKVTFLPASTRDVAFQQRTLDSRAFHASAFRWKKDAEARQREQEDLIAYGAMIPPSASRSADGDQAEPPAPPPLVRALTREQERELVGKVVARKLRLANVVREVTFLEGRGFPLPESLTDEQWRRLLGLLEREFRNRYLASVVDGTEEQTYAEVKALDDAAQEGLEFNEEFFEGCYDPEQVAESGRPMQDRLDMIRYVYEEMRGTGEILPLELGPLAKKELIALNSPKRMQRFFQAKGLIRGRKDLDFIKKCAKKKDNIMWKNRIRKERSEEDHLVYGLAQNTISLRHYPATVQKEYSWYPVREFHEWGQPLVLDLSFFNTMSYKSAKSMSYREITYSLLANRETPFTPFQLHFTNFDPECDKQQLILDWHPHIDAPDYPAMCHRKCHTEIFDKDRLVYLSPDSNNDLTYDPDDIYIVGLLNDTGHHSPFTLAQAKRDGIRHARLPMKKYLGLRGELNVETCVQILLDFVRTRDWFYSLRWVPSRHLRTRYQVSGDSVQMEALWRAHAALSPATHWHLMNISPGTYRKEYNKILTEVTSGRGEERQRRREPARARPFQRRDNQHVEPRFPREPKPKRLSDFGSWTPEDLRAS